MRKLFTEFEKMLKKRKTTIYRVAKDTDIPLSVLYDWKYGKSTPKVDKLKKIADYFQVPLEKLI